MGLKRSVVSVSSMGVKSRCVHTPTPTPKCGEGCAPGRAEELCCLSPVPSHLFGMLQVQKKSINSELLQRCAGSSRVKACCLSQSVQCVLGAGAGEPWSSPAARRGSSRHARRCLLSPGWRRSRLVQQRGLPAAPLSIALL